MKSNVILIVEDEPAIADIYKFRLELEGFGVCHAQNGREGIELAKRYQPSLILLDLKMPVMNGDEMLKQLRAEDWGASIRVVILTNISREEAPRDLSLLGVDRYIVKAHTTPSQIVGIVNEILN